MNLLIIHCTVSVSNITTSNIGLPQGAVISPTLFLLYINDIVNVSDLFSYILFADDTTLFATDYNFNSLISNINLELEKIESWTRANRLSLNVGKTFALIFL